MFFHSHGLRLERLCWGKAKVSKLNDIDRTKRVVGKIQKLLNPLIDSLDPDHNDLPIDGLSQLIIINQDCEEFVEYISDYHSYDPV